MDSRHYQRTAARSPKSYKNEHTDRRCVIELGCLNRFHFHSLHIKRTIYRPLLELSEEAY